MKVTAKFGIAVLAAVLLSSPLCICAGPSVKVAEHQAPPCHPTKSVPVHDDCTKPGCIFIDTSTAPTIAAQLNELGLPCEPPLIEVSIDRLPSFVNSSIVPVMQFTVEDRVVTLHQFLI